MFIKAQSNFTSNFSNLFFSHPTHPYCSFSCSHREIVFHVTGCFWLSFKLLEGGEIVIRIYYIKKNLFSINGKNEKSRILKHYVIYKNHCIAAVTSHIHAIHNFHCSIYELLNINIILNY